MIWAFWTRYSLLTPGSIQTPYRPTKNSNTVPSQQEFKHRTVPPRIQTPYRPTKNSNTVPSHQEFKHRTVPPRTQTPYRPTKNSNTVPSQQIFKHCTTVPLLAWPLIISCKLFLPRSPTRISLVIRRMRRDVGKHSFENRNIRS